LHRLHTFFQQKGKKEGGYESVIYGRKIWKNVCKVCNLCNLCNSVFRNGVCTSSKHGGNERVGERKKSAWGLELLMV
jgi:hypothetical protein